MCCCACRWPVGRCGSAVFGHLFAWDLLTFRRKRFQPEAATTAGPDGHGFGGRLEGAATPHLRPGGTQCRRRTRVPLPSAAGAGPENGHPAAGPLRDRPGLFDPELLHVEGDAESNHRPPARATRATSRRSPGSAARPRCATWACWPPGPGSRAPSASGRQPPEAFPRAGAMPASIKGLFALLVVFLVLSAGLGYAGIAKLHHREYPPFNDGLYATMDKIRIRPWKRSGFWIPVGAGFWPGPWPRPYSGCCIFLAFAEGLPDRGLRPAARGDRRVWSRRHEPFPPRPVRRASLG
jgi:hypothetical protein